MIKQILIILLLILIAPLSLKAQDPLSEADIREMVEKDSEQKLVVQCAVLMQEGFSYYAEIIADKLIALRPESANYNFRKGSLLLAAHNDYVNAKPYLEKAILNVDPEYDMYSAREKSSPVDAFFYLGRCYHLDESIDEAIYYYQKFIDQSPPESDLVALARLRIQQCHVAKREITNPKSARVENVGPVINNNFPDYCPVTSLDGSALYYTSRRPWEDDATSQYRDRKINQYPEDVYVSYIDFDGSWIEPFRLDFCIGIRNEATMAVSADERRIYVYQDDSLANGDIFYSDFATNRFQEIQSINDSRINTMYWEPHCMVSADGMTMYFTSDRPGGFGGRDIYRVIKLPDNSWSDPINLGPSINTPFDEDAPFIAIDNKTLYFSSNGPLSMGDFDVFVSRKDEENNWSSPINLGYPLNSTSDDIYYTTTVDGLRGFLSSNRKGGYGEKDIYEIKNDYLGLNAIAVLKGLVKTRNNKPLPEDVTITITCNDCDNSEPRVVFPRLRDGAYFSSLEPCHEYELLYTYKEQTIEIYRETVTTSCSDAYDEIYREVIIDIADDGVITRVDDKAIPVDTVVVPPVDTVVIIDTIVPPADTIIAPDPVKDPVIVPIPKDTIPVDKIQDLPELVAGDFKNPKFKHYFEYNRNKINPKRGDFKKFVRAIEEQLEKGRTNIAINVYASASHVPTKTYETNERLTALRAENIKYDLITYFQENTDYADKIVVTVVEAVVAGPEYQKDWRNRKKYRNFQYVEVLTE